MRQSHRIVGVACACLLAALVSAGCAKKTPVTTPPPQKSSETSPAATTTAEMPPDQTGEPITTPVSGTVARKQLMDAARKKLGTASEFVVYQLYVQGDQAIGDLEAVSGGARQFVIFKGPEWEAVWAAPFGSASASTASARSGVPGFSDKLLARTDWKFVKPASNAAMIASLSNDAKKWAKTLMEGLGQPYVVTSAKVAQDSEGGWWGRVIVQPTSSAKSSFESIDYWCTYSAGAWTGTAQDPEPPAPTTYFPASVVGSLGF